MEGGNEGEVGKQSNNLGLRELRRRIGQKKRSSVQLLPTLQVQSEVSKLNPLSIYVHPISFLLHTQRCIFKRPKTSFFFLLFLGEKKIVFKKTVKVQ